MTNPSEIPEYRFLPPGELLDPYNPNNSAFFKSLQHAKRALVAQQALMHPHHVEIVKMRFKGRKVKDIAAQLDLSPNTVSRVINSPEGKDLRFLMQHFAALNEGPSLEHRKRVLWEIVIDNQEVEPKTAIAALQEMNKMDGVGKDSENSGEVTIVIDQKLLPRTKLDE